MSVLALKTRMQVTSDAPLLMSIETRREMYEALDRIAALESRAARAEAEAALMAKHLDRLNHNELIASAPLAAAAARVIECAEALTEVAESELTDPRITPTSWQQMCDALDALRAARAEGA